MLQKIASLMITLIKFIFGIKDNKGDNSELIKKEEELKDSLKDLSKQKESLTEDSISDIIDRLNKK